MSCEWFGFYVPIWKCKVDMDVKSLLDKVVADLSIRASGDQRGWCKSKISKFNLFEPLKALTLSPWEMLLFSRPDLNWAKTLGKLAWINPELVMWSHEPTRDTPLYIFWRWSKGGQQLTRHITWKQKCHQNRFLF